MDLAGHTCIETTMLFYTHSTDDLLKDSINSLEEYKNREADRKKHLLWYSMIGHNSRRKLK